MNVALENLVPINGTFTSLVAFSSVAMISGCAPSYTWENPNIAPGEVSRQLSIDKAECTVYGMNSVPVPARTAVPLPPPAVPRYETSEVSLVDIYGNTYSGTVETNTSSARVDAISATAEAAASAQASVDDYRINKAYQAQDSMAEACMLQRGWQKVAVPQ